MPDSFGGRGVAVQKTWISFWMDPMGLSNADKIGTARCEQCNYYEARDYSNMLKMIAVAKNDCDGKTEDTSKYKPVKVYKKAADNHNKG
eukprot:1408191-Amphidinium_carterae.1